MANPDPNWYPGRHRRRRLRHPWSLYAWGDAFLYDHAATPTAIPSAWTVLDPAPMSVESKNGKRAYRSGQTPLEREDVVQITRDPRGGLRGTSAIASYSSYTNGLLAAADLGRVMMGSGGTPNAVLKSHAQADGEQAAALQAQWMSADRRCGAARRRCCRRRSTSSSWPSRRPTCCCWTCRSSTRR